MAKRNYENKIALAAKNFVDIKEQESEEPVKAAPVEKKEEKKPEAKDPKPSQPKKPSVEKTKEKKDTPKEPAIDNNDPVAEKVNDIIRSMIDSGQLMVKSSAKAGRPSKYKEDLVASSIRLTKTNHDYAYKMGRTKFGSTNEYINYLIEKDMNS